MRRTEMFTAIVSQEGTIFVARCAEIEVASQGQSAADAVKNLREAVELLLEDDSAPKARAQAIPFEVHTAV